MTQPLLARIRQFLADPPRAFEIGIWVFLVAALAAVRIYLWHLLPFFLWSKDAGSYALSAWQWLDGDGWVTDPRRGPIYSLFLAGCLKTFGSFDAVIIVQHVLGGLSVFAAIVFFRNMVSRRALLVVAVTGWAYAVYGGPISMEVLIRNETLLLLFATSTLMAWRLALLGSRHWLWLCGMSAGLLALTKSVFVPFPFIALFALYWLNRGNQRKRSSAWPFSSARFFFQCLAKNCIIK